MNRLEHLLFKVAEECAEVAQRASKSARFGMDEVQASLHGNPKALNNHDRLRDE